MLRCHPRLALRFLHRSIRIYFVYTHHHTFASRWIQEQRKNAIIPEGRLSTGPNDAGLNDRFEVSAVPEPSLYISSAKTAAVLYRIDLSVT